MKDNYKVYMHISPSNKVYIGITKQDVNRRWGKNGNGYDKKTQSRFVNAINRYGWNNFQHIILFTNLTKEEAEQKEIELIAKYNSNNPLYGYNITAGGDLLSISTVARKVNQYDLQGNYIKTYESCAEAERQLGHREDNGTILKAAKGIYITAYDYAWCFSDECFDKELFLKKLQQKKFNITNTNTQKIYQFDINKKLIKQFNSIRQASRELRIDHSVICRACQRGNLVHKQFYFSYSS